MQRNLNKSVNTESSPDGCTIGNWWQPKPNTGVGTKCTSPGQICVSSHVKQNKQKATQENYFFSEPVAFRRVYGLESYSRTSGESNHHRQSVSDKSAAIPTAPRGRLNNTRKLKTAKNRPGPEPKQKQPSPQPRGHREENLPMPLSRNKRIHVP